MAAILSRPQCGIDLCLLCYVSDCNPRVFPLQLHHNGHNIVSNHQPRVCLLNRLFRRRSKKTSKIRVPGLCTGNSPVTGEFPAQMASNAENVSIWWRHHATTDMQRHILPLTGWIVVREHKVYLNIHRFAKEAWRWYLRYWRGKKTAAIVWIYRQVSNIRRLIVGN